MPSRESASLLYLIKRVELAVRKRLAEEVEASGLSIVQYTALTALERHPGMTAAALARHSFVTAQTTAELVRALESLGLIQRFPDPASKRQHRISLTDAGQRRLEEVRPRVDRIEAEMLAGMDSAERDAIRRALRELRTRLES